MLYLTVELVGWWGAACVTDATAVDCEAAGCSGIAVLAKHGACCRYGGAGSGVYGRSCGVLGRCRTGSGKGVGAAGAELGVDWASRV